MKWLLVCASVALCYSLHGQAPDQTIEVDGVQVRPGITVSEALLLFKGRQVVRNEGELAVTVPMKGPDGKTYPSVVGTLSVKDDIAVSACRWNYPEANDDLARILFAAMSVSNSKEDPQSAVIETATSRKANQTVETISIRAGQHTIELQRQEFYGPQGPVVTVTVFECLLKPGSTKTVKH